MDAACDADCPEGRKLGGKGLRVLGSEPLSIRRESKDGSITALAITLPGGSQRYVSKFEAHHLGSSHGVTGQCTEQDCSWQRQTAVGANGELTKVDLLPIVFGDDETLLFCWYAQ